MVRSQQLGRYHLLDRLSFEVVTLPPLRHRQSDIPILTDFFARRMAVELEWDDFPGFSEEAMATLQGYAWPGNVRELRNVVERAVDRWEGQLGPVQRDHSRADVVERLIDWTKDLGITLLCTSLVRDAGPHVEDRDEVAQEKALLFEPFSSRRRGRVQEGLPLLRQRPSGARPVDRRHLRGVALHLGLRGVRYRRRAPREGGPAFHHRCPGAPPTVRPAPCG
mgnify:CR=1 FL=1